MTKSKTSKSKTSSTLTHKLPKEIWIEIMKHLSIKDLLMMSEVSKQFYSFAANDELWKSKYYSITSNPMLNVPSPSSFKSLYLEAWTNACYPSLKLKNMNWALWRNPKDVIDPATNQIAYDYLMKITFAGDNYSGKSSILLRFVDNTFTDSYVSTIGVDFKIKRVGFQNSAIKLQIWDTAGQERFRTLSYNPYRGSHGIFLVFDLADKDSWNNIKQWKEEVERYASEHVKIVVLGTKSDLTEERKVTPEEIKDYVDSIDGIYVEVSSKTGENIDLAFAALVNQWYISKEEWNRPRTIVTQKTKTKTCCVM